MASKPQAAATAAHPTSFKYKHALAMQEETRKARQFEKTESDLSSLALRQTVAPTSAKFSVPGKFQDILSYLGTKNPFPRTIGKDDTVWLLDNTAYRNAKTGKWETEYVAAMFSQHTSSPVMDAVNLVARQIDMSEDDDGYGTLQERLMPFLQDIRPGTTVRVLHGGQSPPIKLGPGGRNGISADIKQIPDSTEGQITTTFAKVPSGANGILECRTFYAEPEGWGVISDIDDTIKITQTSDPIGILQTTFVDTPQVCPGMPEFYQRIQSMIKETSPWFYLSASPYNLYPFLRDFRQHHYPHGTIVLRDSSWMSIPGLLQTLTLGTEDYKVDRMEKIHDWLPKRKMICIGDSTQSDPEAYGEIYRKYPGWVKIILIRKVEDIAAIGIERKNEPQRFEAAFKDVPRDAWHVFHSPTECDELIQRVVAKDP